MLVWLCAEQVVLKDEFWRKFHGLLFVLCLMCDCHRVRHRVLVFQQLARSGITTCCCGDVWVHRVESARVVTILILFINRKVWHLIVGDSQKVSCHIIYYIAIVLLVFRVSEVEVSLHLDAVADEIVEGDTCGEAVELLLDDRTCLMVVTT